jgi:hypothetical protein
MFFEEEGVMQKLIVDEWIYYINENIENDEDSHSIGKWMYFFDDIHFVSEICEKAIEQNVVKEVKHSNLPKGVVCFYIDGKDIEEHKKVLKFFLANRLIQKTKKGKYYNISFKYDFQTRAGEYGDDYRPIIKLEQFIDLDTGRWIV